MMRMTVLLLSLLAVPACAVEEKKDKHLDPAPTATEVKAMESRIDPAVRKALADAIKAEAPQLYLPYNAPSFSAGRSDIMTAAFNEAKLPDCLHSEGLKNQPTFLLTGWLALPFIPIAALRGVCN